MSGKTMRAALGALLFGATLAGAAQAQSPPPPPSDRWTFTLTPYLWLPSVEGTLQYRQQPGSPSVSLEETSWLDALDGLFMLSGEARRGRWSFFGDYIYMKFATDKSRVAAVDFNAGGPLNPVSTTLNAGTQSELKGHMLTLAAGYTVAGNGGSHHDAIGGLRYLDIAATTSWQLSAAVIGPGVGQTFAASGTTSRSMDLWDAIVGARGRVRLAERWFLPYYADVGAGSSKLTWQALGGVSYAFRWLDVTLAYRHLVYDQKDDRLLQDFKFSGPLLGATFRF